MITFQQLIKTFYESNSVLLGYRIFCDSLGRNCYTIRTTRQKYIDNTSKFQEEPKYIVWYPPGI